MSAWLKKLVSWSQRIFSKPGTQAIAAGLVVALVGAVAGAMANAHYQQQGDAKKYKLQREYEEMRLAAQRQQDLQTRQMDLYKRMMKELNVVLDAHRNLIDTSDKGKDRESLLTKYQSDTDQLLVNLVDYKADIRLCCPQPNLLINSLEKFTVQMKTEAFIAPKSVKGGYETQRGLVLLIERELVSQSDASSK